MSSLVRRMQLASKRRRQQRSGSAGPDAQFGSMLGVKNPRNRQNARSRGSRRGKHNSAYIERRKAVAP